MNSTQNDENVPRRVVNMKACEEKSSSDCLDLRTILGGLNVNFKHEVELLLVYLSLAAMNTSCSVTNGVLLVIKGIDKHEYERSCFKISTPTFKKGQGSWHVRPLEIRAMNKFILSGMGYTENRFGELQSS